MTCFVAPRLRGFHTTAWTLSGAILCALSVPWLFRRGMFWDGVVYGTVARNLAKGVGDAWHPQVTSTFLRHFREHPPLGLWLQAGFFRILGDHFWVERFYSLTTLLITGFFLLATWRWLLRDRPGAAACSWVAALLWAPFGMWCYRHNLLENTLGMFTALAVHASLRAVESRRGASIGWSILSGLAIVAAVMSKGPLGLFPAVTPFIAWLALRPMGLAKAFSVQALVLFSLAAASGAILISPAAREYLTGYWQQQIVSSLTGDREIVPSIVGHLNIVFWLARALGIPAAIVGGLMLLVRVRHGVVGGADRPTGPMWFCLLTALSASLPIMISPKQGGHYVAPSWPFYMFSLTLWCMPALQELSSRLSEWQRLTVLRYVASAIVTGTILFSALTYGTCARDKRLIELVDRVGGRVPPHSIVAAQSDSWNNLETGERLVLHAYLHRYHAISIWADEPQPAWNFACFRLEPPDPNLVMSDQPIATSAGLEWYPLVPRAQANTAAARNTLR